MQQMDSMFRDPFGAMGGGGLMALPGADGGRDQRRRRQQQGQNLAVAERNTFMDPFSHFDSMFSNMRNMMSEMHRAFVSLFSTSCASWPDLDPKGVRLAPIGINPGLIQI